MPLKQPYKETSQSFSFGNLEMFLIINVSVHRIVCNLLFYISAFVKAIIRFL